MKLMTVYFVGRVGPLHIWCIHLGFIFVYYYCIISLYSMLKYLVLIQHADGVSTPKSPIPSLGISYNSSIRNKFQNGIEYTNETDNART